MPTYEYRCENGHDFEAFQRMSDDPLDVCPECGAPAERKISSGAGLVFKGSGFYATDYKRAGEKTSREGGEKRASAAGESKNTDAGGGSDTAAGKGGTKKSD